MQTYYVHLLEHFQKFINNKYVFADSLLIYKMSLKCGFLLNEFHHSFSDALKTDCNFFLNPPKCSSFQRNCEETVMLWTTPQEQHFMVYVRLYFCLFHFLSVYFTYLFSYILLLLFVFLSLSQRLTFPIFVSFSICLSDKACNSRYGTLFHT